MLGSRTETRRTAAYKIREEAAEQALLRSHPEHRNNGEEAQYRTPTPAGPLRYIANFSKALPHNLIGEVNPTAYRALVRALHSESADLFERVPLGLPSARRLTNPQAGLAYDLEGPDAQAVTQRPAPRIDGAENSAEMGELYWMALLRDVHFRDYGTGGGSDAGPDNTSAAAASLTNDFTRFTGPRDPATGAVTPATLFRGVAPGDAAGPYVSQFLVIGNADPALGLSPDDGFISYGTLKVDQRQRTTMPGVDFLTRFESVGGAAMNWLSAQNGANYLGADQFDARRRFIRNLRDLATYVHFDALYEAYLNACLILLNLNAPFDPGNPYVDSRTQDGFGTFGGPHILSLVTEVATRALKAVWFQKWVVHRRLRPEEFGGRIHVHVAGLPIRPGRPAVAPGRYPMINPEILNLAPGSVLARIRNHNAASFGDNTFLLPQAFPEGSPTHPSYGAGHATVAGACVTILKAWFDESFVLPGPVLQADAAGTALVPVASPPLTVGGELNKLAANIAIARNAAGVHWRSDYTESILLGEHIAIGILQEQRLTYNEDHHFSLTTFNGEAVRV
jgi:PAP2 superfamily